MDPPGRRRVMSWGRKLLGELELSGNGAGVETTDVGASGSASGHGVVNGFDDTHIEVRNGVYMPEMPLFHASVNIYVAGILCLHCAT